MIILVCEGSQSSLFMQRTVVICDKAHCAITETGTVLWEQREKVILKSSSLTCVIISDLHKTFMVQSLDMCNDCCEISALYLKNFTTYIYRF